MSIRFSAKVEQAHYHPDSVSRHIYEGVGAALDGSKKPLGKMATNVSNDIIDTTVSNPHHPSTLLHELEEAWDNYYNRVNDWSVGPMACIHRDNESIAAINFELLQLYNKCGISRIGDISIITHTELLTSTLQKCAADRKTLTGKQKRDLQL